MTNLLQKLMKSGPNELLHTALKAIDRPGPEDALQYGVKGMKWGVRKDRGKGGDGGDSSKSKKKSPGPNGGTMQEVYVNKKTGSTHEINPDGSVGKQVDTAPKQKTTEKSNPGLKALTGEETSAARYSRLQNEAKSGLQTNWTDQDLKFFNARTEAIGKINKMYQKEPNWLVETLKDTAKQQAKNALNQYVGNVTQNYIKELTKAPPETAESIANKKVAELKRNSEVQKLIDEAFSGGGTRIKGSGRRVRDS